MKTELLEQNEVGVESLAPQSEQAVPDVVMDDEALLAAACEKLHRIEEVYSSALLGIMAVGQSAGGSDDRCGEGEFRQICEERQSAIREKMQAEQRVLFPKTA